MVDYENAVHTTNLVNHIAVFLIRRWFFAVLCAVLSLSLGWHQNKTINAHPSGEMSLINISMFPCFFVRITKVVIQCEIKRNWFVIIRIVRPASAQPSMFLCTHQNKKTNRGNFVGQIRYGKVGWTSSKEIKQFNQLFKRPFIPICLLILHINFHKTKSITSSFTETNQVSLAAPKQLSKGLTRETFWIHCANVLFVARSKSRTTKKRTKYWKVFFALIITGITRPRSRN